MDLPGPPKGIVKGERDYQNQIWEVYRGDILVKYLRSRLRTSVDYFRQHIVGFRS